MITYVITYLVLKVTTNECSRMRNEKLPTLGPRNRNLCPPSYPREQIGSKKKQILDLQRLEKLRGWQDCLIKHTMNNPELPFPCGGRGW